MNKIKLFVTDCFTMFKRCTKISFRNLDMFLMSILMPGILMILFVYLFGGAMDPNHFESSYVNYVVAGVIVLTVGQCASSSAVIIASDLHNGMLDRFSSLPISRSAFLIGHVLSSVFRNIISTIIVLLIAFAIGFRPEANFIQWLAISAILIVFMIIMAWLSVLFGLISRSVEAAGGMTIIVMLLPYLSSGFVPTDTMPPILRFFAEYQPLTSIIETLRSLFLNSTITQGFTMIIWCTILLVLGYTTALLVFRRRTN